MKINLQEGLASNIGAGMSEAMPEQASNRGRPSYGIIKSIF